MLQVSNLKSQISNLKSQKLLTQTKAIVAGIQFVFHLALAGGPQQLGPMTSLMILPTMILLAPHKLPSDVPVDDRSEPFKGQPSWFVEVAGVASVRTEDQSQIEMRHRWL